ISGQAMMRQIGFLFLVFTLGTSVPALADNAATDAQILHLLNRISYGPAPGDIDAVRRVGVQDYIEQQLHPERFERPEFLQQRLENLPTLNASIPSLINDYWVIDKDKKQMSEDDRKQVNERENTALRELMEAKILRAAADPAQLQEVMTDFWF